jgi:hypothetical protein
MTTCPNCEAETLSTHCPKCGYDILLKAVRPGEEVFDSMRWVGDGDALRAQITAHMTILRNAARADFVEWVTQEHYRMARAENAKSPTVRLSDDAP